MKLCILQEILPIGCPGCGLTRALFALLRGELHSSISLNPMLFPLLAISLFFIFLRLTKRHISASASWLLSMGFLMGLLVQWIARFAVLR